MRLFSTCHGIRRAMLFISYSKSLIFSFVRTLSLSLDFSLLGHISILLSLSTCVSQSAFLLRVPMSLSVSLPISAYLALSFNLSRYLPYSICHSVILSLSTSLYVATYHLSLFIALSCSLSLPLYPISSPCAFHHFNIVIPIVGLNPFISIFTHP